MAGVSAIFSLVSCNTPVYSCASVQAPIFFPYILPVISFNVCSKFIFNPISARFPREAHYFSILSVAVFPESADAISSVFQEK